MNAKKKVMILGTYAAIMLVVISCSYLLDPADNNIEDPDLVGTWALVSKESMDNGPSYSRTTYDSNYDIEITETYGNIFTARTQGVDFSGIQIEHMVMFEYRYGETAWVRASGNIIDGILVMYEMHYYTDDYWFVSISKYSKDDKRPDPPHNMPPFKYDPWMLREGYSHYFDIVSGPEEYALEGRTFYISGGQGNIFRAEMQQGADGSIVTRHMNGIFTSITDNARTAIMLDESGKVWTLSIHNDLVTLRTIVISEYVATDPMVVTERKYFNGITPHVDTAPDMTGTWNATIVMGIQNGIYTVPSGPITTIYTDQFGYVFIGSTPASSLPEVGYVVYDPNAHNGWLVRIGTDLGGGEYKEGYAFLNDDATKMTMVEFTWDGITNGVMVYEFVKG